MDPAKVVEVTRPTRESWGLSPQKARWAADKHFDPHYTGFVNLACACGGDPEKCTTGLESGVVGVEVARQKHEADHQSAAGHAEHAGH
ncbi:MAG: hypothetical protein FJ034_00830 [Chloroflexi bacterium]|nr:hypothetical protein [Chloroflexota bacterium]